MLIFSRLFFARSYHREIGMCQRLRLLKHSGDCHLANFINSSNCIIFVRKLNHTLGPLVVAAFFVDCLFCNVSSVSASGL